MFKTISISISRFPSFFLLLILLSCQQDTDEDQKQVAPEAVPKAPEEMTGETADRTMHEVQKLSNENAEDFLLQYARNHPADEAVIKTPMGNIRISLYKNTPLHRANFIYLTRHGYYDDTWFYRVSKDHVIQAGNTDLQETVRKRMAMGDYRVPSETGAGNYHRRGAVAAVRSYYQNPEKNSDPYEFYIVIGQEYSRRQLERLAEKHEMNFSEDQYRFYSNNAGAPHLDGEHTVFGEVIEGMDVAEKINEVQVDEGEWPLVNIPIDVEVVD